MQNNHDLLCIKSACLSLDNTQNLTHYVIMVIWPHVLCETSLFVLWPIQLKLLLSPFSLSLSLSLSLSVSPSFSSFFVRSAAFVPALSFSCYSHTHVSTHKITICRQRKWESKKCGGHSSLCSCKVDSRHYDLTAGLRQGESE